MTSSSVDETKETTLSPEVRRIRNSIIKKFADEPLDIMAKFVKDVVDNEEDTVKRLGAMAARVEILRMRIAQISQEDRPSVLDTVSEEIVEEEHTFEDTESEIVITNPNLSDWVRLRIIENSEINGVRFPKGVVIDVSQEDGDRLLEAGKASYVNEDEIDDVKSEVKARKEKLINEETTDAKPDNSKQEASELNGEDSAEEEPTASADPTSVDLPDDEKGQENVKVDEEMTDAKPDNSKQEASELKADDSAKEEPTASADPTSVDLPDDKKGKENVKVEEESSTLKSSKTKKPVPKKIKDEQSTDEMLTGFDLDSEDGSSKP